VFKQLFQNLKKHPSSVTKFNVFNWVHICHLKFHKKIKTHFCIFLSLSSHKEFTELKCTCSGQCVVKNIPEAEKKLHPLKKIVIQIDKCSIETWTKQNLGLSPSSLFTQKGENSILTPSTECLWHIQKNLAHSGFIF
jgi:hypothetical protein